MYRRIKIWHRQIKTSIQSILESVIEMGDLCKFKFIEMTTLSRLHFN